MSGKKNVSVAMTYILRHNPLQFGIVLDENGACPIDDLVMALNSQKKFCVKENDIMDIVSSCPKQRFEASDGMIKARYGHSSVKVSRQATESSFIPPKLVHGTSWGSLYREPS